MIEIENPPDELTPREKWVSFKKRSSKIKHKRRQIWISDETILFIKAFAQQHKMYNEEAADYLVRKGLKAEQFPGPGGPKQGAISRIIKAIRRKNDRPQAIPGTTEDVSDGDSSSAGD